MASWTPLNVYPDSDSDGEVDNTEELQIEEALKLYQRALKLHTEEAWEQAEAAYEDLFQSDIFQLDPDFEDEADASNWAGQSSLRLVFYLAFKNHGTFKLDRLKKTPDPRKREETLSTVAQALDWFTTALARDSGDPTLWRQAAQLCRVLCSARATRFALESVLDHSTVGADSSRDTLARIAGFAQDPEEYLSTYSLRDLLQRICDDLTLSRPPFNRIEGKKVNPRLAGFTDPYKWLPAEETKQLATMIKLYTAKRRVLQIDSRTWLAVGTAISSALSNGIEEGGAVEILAPFNEDEAVDGSATPEETSTAEEGTKSDVAVADYNEDVSMGDVSTATADPDRRRSDSSARKRKSTSMGADMADGGRSRLSKRQRDKKDADAAAAAGVPESQKVRHETQDEKLFNTAYECFSPLGISLGTASSLKIYTEGAPESADKDGLHLQDFKKILQTWDDDKGNVVLYGDGIQSVAEATQGMAYLDLEANIPSRPMLMGDEGLRGWIRNINARELVPETVGLEWLRALCKRDQEPMRKRKTSGSSAWTKYNWPDHLKTAVLDIASQCEGAAWRMFREYERNCRETASSFGEEDHAMTEWAQTMLELYLEDHAYAERHRTGTELGEESEDSVAKKRETAHRWTYLVGDMLQHRPREDGQLIIDELTLRHLWARAIFTGSDDETREIRLQCFEDLRQLLEEKKVPPIELPNCTVMPEISTGRAERELSKLKTVDFFDQIFKATPGNNVETVIETLEAVLKPGAVLPYDDEEDRMLRDIGRFLDGSSALYKLELWDRLKTAYQHYGDRCKPEMLACTWKCMQVVMDDLKSRNYVESSADHRQFVLLRSLRQAEALLAEATNIISASPAILEKLQNNEILGAMSTSMVLLRLLHCYTFWEDAVMKTEARASDLHSYRLVISKLREMLVNAWVVVYHLYSEALTRGLGGEFSEGERNERLALLLRDLHEELGVRHYCRLNGHMFLKLLFYELLRFNNPDYQPDLLQCIHCRFHLMLCSDQFYFYEHKTNAEPLDQPTALMILDLVLYHANKKGVSKLVKSDLKVGLDRMVDVLGIPRPQSNLRIAHNETIIEQYLRTSINPLHLVGCLNGELSLSTVTISGDICGLVAQKGLYTTLGMISLYPLRQTKKSQAVRADDLTTTINYFKYDLICRPDNWGTWYRVGQTLDVQMDEAQTWNADHINSRRQLLVGLERSTILCFMMALSLAVQDPDVSEDKRKTLSALYTDFGYRVYSAARPPMALESFWVDGFERHYSGRHGEGMYKARPHGELSLKNALIFALRMFRNALIEGDGNWKNHYMIGKCMGKLHRKGMFDPEQILQKYVDAIQRNPEKEIKDRDFTFEPHHKLVSAACKHVLKEELEPRRACEILQATKFARNKEPVDTITDYVHYTLEVFKKMKAADKPKWHHRMTYRSARFRYEHLGDVAGARAEFSPLWTNKGAQLSIWKPEFERPGRHFVFASHYTMFYTELLGRQNDRTTLEVMSKRVRKMSNALFRHLEVWLHVFTTYISVLRSTGNVPTDNEDEVFRNVSYEEFTNHSARLEAHCCRPGTEGKTPTVDLLLEVYELRRLNAGLAKTPTIDDLLADTYAKLYAELVPQLVQQQAQQENAAAANPMSVRNLMFDSAPEGGAPGATEELPLRGSKLTRVTRRELVSKASALCKEMTAAPARSMAAVLPSNATAPSSPRQDDAENGNNNGDSDAGRPQLDLSGLPNITIVDE